MQRCGDWGHFWCTLLNLGMGIGHVCANTRSRALQTFVWAALHSRKLNDHLCPVICYTCQPVHRQVRISICSSPISILNLQFSFISHVTVGSSNGSCLKKVWSSKCLELGWCGSGQYMGRLWEWEKFFHWSRVRFGASPVGWSCNLGDIVCVEKIGTSDEECKLNECVCQLSSDNASDFDIEKSFGKQRNSWDE